MVIIDKNTTIHRMPEVSATDSIDLYSKLSTLGLGGLGGYHNIIDSTINAALMTAMSGKTLNISAKTIMYIIIFSSINEIKGLLKWLIEKIKDNGMKHILEIIKYSKIYGIRQYFIPLVMKIKSFFSSNKYEIKKSSFTQITEHKKHTYLQINDNFQVFDAILTYIDENPTKGSYERKIINTETKNLHERIEEVIVYNVNIIFDDIRVYFKNDVYVEYTWINNNNGERNNIVDGMMMTRIYMKKSKEKGEIEPEIIANKKTINSLTQLLDNKYVIDLLDKYTDMITNISWSIPSYKLDVIHVNDDKVLPGNIIESLGFVYGSLFTENKRSYLTAQLLIILYYADYEIRFTEKKICFDKLSTSFIFDTNLRYDMSKCGFDVQNKKQLKNQIEQFMGTNKQTFDIEFGRIIEQNKKQIVYETNVVIDLEVSENKVNENEMGMIEKWNQYLYNNIINVYINKKLNVHSVTVYTLKIGEIVTEEELENPDFLAYMHKKEMYEMLIKNKKIDTDNNTEPPEDSPNLCNTTKRGQDNHNSENCENKSRGLHSTHNISMIIGMGLQNIPPKTIIKKNIKQHVVCTKEGTVKKRLDTLYLRETDHKRLTTILRNFKECSSLYDDLCINKKLGIMLHGVPGTGKSSTIMAIATYLNYDIYYISLNGINKNSQLKMIFDYVTKNCSKRGILVFEDIDAQSDVVHKRVTIMTQSNNDTMTEIFDESNLSVHNLENKKDDDLDLSFLLNTLDGTLSQNSMVYIMTTNHLERIDPALYRKGRIHAIIQLKKCDHYQIACIFEKIMKRKINREILKNMREDTYTPADIIHHFLENINNIHMSDEEIINNLYSDCKDYMSSDQLPNT